MRVPKDETGAGGGPLSHVRLDVELVRGLEAMALLRESWIALEGALGEPDFFQSFAWSMQVAEVRVRCSPPGCYEPLCAIGRHGSAIVALWPLARVKHAGQHELRNIDDPFGQLAGVLALAPAAGAQLVEKTLDTTRGLGLADVVRFERVIQGSVLGAALAAAGARATGAVDAPWVSLREQATFADLKQSRNRKSMKNLRNAINRMERAGQVTSRVARDPAAAVEIGRAALANRERWLEATARTAPAFRVAGFADVLLGPSRWRLEEKRAGLELRLDDVPIAQQLGFIHDNRYYAYISGMDWTRGSLAPGRVHLAMVLEAAHAAGYDRAELLTPASDYKMMWTDRTHRLADMVLPLSIAGRVKQTLWNEGLRPALKSAYYAMPAPWRRAAGGLARQRQVAETATDDKANRKST